MDCLQNASMDKQDQSAPLLKAMLESLDLAALAKESGWSPKSRKVTALGWCLSLCLASSHRTPSLRVAAAFMGLVNALTITKQALCKRLAKGGGKLLEKALGAALATKARCELPSLGSFPRVLIQDSACIALPKAASKHYPGSSNQHDSTAAMKVQAIYEMVSNRFVGFSLGGYTRNDQAAALDIVELAREGDLVLRDLGYLTLESLRRIGSLGAYYLSRYMSGTALYAPATGERLELARLANPARTVQIDVHLGNEARLPCRLILVPLKEEVANRRRQKAKACRDRRKAPGERTLHLLGWQIMLTNYSEQELPASLVFELYSMRWRIETIFKSWKGGLGIDSLPARVSKATLDATVHAALLRITLLHAVVIPWLQAKDPAREVSVCKLMDLVSIGASLVGIDSIANENLLENLSKHCRHEKRKRRNTLERWDKLVTQMENLS